MTSTGESYTPTASERPSEVDVKEKLKDFLERNRAAIVAAASNRIEPDRIIKLALLTVTKQPKFVHPKMDKMTILRSVIEAASLGLEPGSSLGEAYLVPYWSNGRSCYECQMIIGYRGLVNLARRSGSIAGVDARPVFEGEQFEPHYGTEPKIVHVPNFDTPRTPDKLRAVYVVWHLTGETKAVQFDIMSRDEVDAIRKRSKSADDGPWVSDYVEMAKKSVMRRGAKLVPMSTELADALDEDARREFGDLNIGTVVADPPEPKKGAQSTLREMVVKPGPAPAAAPAEASEVKAAPAAIGDGGADRVEADALARAAKVKEVEPQAVELDDLGTDYPELRSAKAGDEEAQQ